MTRNYAAILSRTMSIVKVGKKNHVIRPIKRRSKDSPDPNYLGTKKAFVGVLNTDQTLDQFREKWIEDRTMI